MAARKKNAKKKTPAKKKVGARKVSKTAAPARKKAAPRKKAAASGGLVSKAKAATQALVARAKAATEALVARVKRDAPAPATDGRNATPGMEPFLLTETSPGKYSLLLTTFDAAASAFESAGVDAGGYAWEGVAKHVIATDAAALGERINFDPEASMFCAYGDDRAGLEDLGKRLSAVRRCRGIGKVDMKLNDALPSMRIDPETYEVFADGVLLRSAPATTVALARLYSLF